MNKELRILFFGSDSFVVQVLEKLIENFDVVGVVTTEDSPVAKSAQKYGIPVFTPTKLDEDFSYHLSLISYHLFVVASYGKIIPKSILDIPKYGALNIHPSLLPKYRGPSPVPTTILNGDKETGVTIIKMDEKMDHGPMVTTKIISLSGSEDLSTLITKLFHLGSELLVGIIPDFIEGKVSLKEQNHKKATYTKVLKKEDGYFDIYNSLTPEQLDRMIRAYYPWPGVWTKWKGKIVKFLSNRHSGLSRIDSGVASTPQNDNFLIQMEGKKVLSLKDFLNGYPDFPIKSITFDKM